MRRPYQSLFGPRPGADPYKEIERKAKLYGLKAVEVKWAPSSNFAKVTAIYNNTAAPFTLAGNNSLVRKLARLRNTLGFRMSLSICRTASACGASNSDIVERFNRAMRH